jgi:hypothetical protein
MTSAELAALITAIGASASGIIIAIAALMNARNSAMRVDVLEKENKRLSDEVVLLTDANDKKSVHNDMQDQVIMDQVHKIGQWQAWGERIGRKMNQMELKIGSSEQQRTNDDTHPMKIPKDKDWITGTLGPIDIRDFKIDDK